jgi:ribulose-bisphosphate carboxylase large chain
MHGHVIATYLLESYYPIAQAAEVLAGEQSSGTFIRVPGETDELLQRFRARVIRVEELPAKSAPSLPGAHRQSSTHGSTSVNVGRVWVEFPLENFGPSLPNLVTAVAGNLFELRELAGVRLEDIVIPDEFRTKYPGPQFGTRGTRRLLGVPDGPMVGTIVKPSVGLRPGELAELVSVLVDAGIDFIKDDELIANPPYSPLRDRVRAVMQVINAKAQASGRKVMFAFNITDDIASLQANYELVAEAGGTCVMVVINAIGFAGVAYVRQFCQLPIHGHRAMIGAFMRHPALGIGFRPFQALARLAGVDHLHVGGINSKFYERNDEVVAAINAVREPLLGGFECLPVLSSAQWAGTAPETYALTGSTDYLVVAGGGIHAHPAGVAAGVASIRQGWEAAVGGNSLESYATDHPELAQALATFRIA